MKLRREAERFKGKKNIPKKEASSVGCWDVVGARKRKSCMMAYITWLADPLTADLSPETATRSIFGYTVGIHCQI
jgi:hypothetical protein